MRKTKNKDFRNRKRKCKQNKQFSIKIEFIDVMITILFNSKKLYRNNQDYIEN